MNAPTYINTRLDHEKYNQYVLELHRKRLRQIKSKLPRFSSAQKLQKKSKPVITAEIAEQNRKIVKKLIDIAQQKHSTSSLTPTQSTLNYFSRKKEYERIELENKKLLRKIKDCTSDVSLEVHEKDFSLSQEYKSRISRSFILKKRQNNWKSERKIKDYMSSISLFNN